MKHVLLIESNDQLAGSTINMLKHEDYSIAHATDEKACIACSLQQQPDLIICSVAKPLIKLFDSLPNLRSIPLIFLTEEIASVNTTQHHPLSYGDFIITPVCPNDLLNAIEQKLKPTDNNTAEHLSKKEPFCLSTADILMNFIKNRTINHFKKKQVIYAEGKNPRRLFYIEKGRVKISKKNNEGKELTVGLLNEGEFLGYTALLADTVYKDTAKAMDETDIVVIPKEEFDQLISSNKQVAQKFIRLLAKNVWEKEDQLIGLAYNSLRKRVAEALIQLHQKFKREAQIQFSINISRQDLANIVGTATESLIRTLSDFKNEKLIQIKAGNITILDEKQLQKILY
ncbi:MAG: cyclic nucleotide-binding domain-containing protein [Ferruginibacter sp.]